jgi:hypothetical protein
MGTEPPGPGPVPVSEDHAEGAQPTTQKSRYAVPLSTLVGSPYVATAGQVQAQPDPMAHDWSSGGDADGD